MSSISKLLLAIMLPLALGSGSLQSPTVRVVLFYSPTCPHCHKVIRDDLPGIFERFGGSGRVYFNTGVPEAERTFFLVSNGELEILLINVARPDGNLIYRQSAEALAIPEGRQGVPRLVIGDSVLLGSFEIPEYLPALIEEGRASGGIDWPRIEGVPQALASIPSPPSLAGVARDEADAATETDEPAAVEGPPVSESPSEVADSLAADPLAADSATAPAAAEPPPARRRPEPSVAREAEPVEGRSADAESTESAASTLDDGAPAADPISPPASARVSEMSDLGAITEVRPSMIDLYARDPVGNGLSVAVLLAMVVSLAAMTVMFRSMPDPREPGPLIPLVALLGVAVAVYLTYIESSGAEAVCGPVGDCNAVQASEYARLFGAIPIGAVGLAGYVAILGAWLIGRGNSTIADWGRLSLLAMAVVGVLFSIYLTFLEPFVIGATCAWCLTSALAITLLMWLSARPGLAAWRRLTRSAG